MAIKQTALAVSMSSLLAISVMPATLSADGGSAFVGGLLGGALGSAATNHYYNKKREREAAAQQPQRTYSKSYSQRTPVNSEGVQVQRALSNVGYYSGPLNGNLDSYDSKAAIMQYQARHGLMQTGVLLPEVKGILLHQGDIAEISSYLVNPGYDQRGKAKRLQAALKVHGYYTQKIDGIAGKGTRNAIKLYQQSQGMIPTGALIPSDEDVLVESAMQRIQDQQQQSDQQLIQVANRYRAPQPQQVVPVQTAPQQAQPAPGQVYTQQPQQPAPVYQQQQPVATTPQPQAPTPPVPAAQPTMPDMSGAGAVPAAANNVVNM